MRFAALIVAALALAACGARGSRGPAWPETAERETDGGESIAPRETAIVAAADAEITTPDVVVAPTAGAAATPAATPTTPTVTTPTITAPEDTIMIEEIVIEITDE